VISDTCAADNDSCMVVMAPDDALIVALSAGRVRQVVEAGQQQPPPSHLWDLCELARIQRPSGTQLRILMIDTARPSTGLVVGGMVRVQPLERASLVPLPAFLGGLWSRLPLERAFIWDRRIGFLIDPEALARGPVARRAR
jgi:hypothetical protein